MFTLAAIDPGLAGIATLALVLGIICLVVAVRKAQKRWLIGTACLVAIGCLWMVSALSASFRTERLQIADLYYTYGHCTEQADETPTGYCGHNPIQQDYIKTNQGTFQDSGSLYGRMQVGQTYTCRVEHFSGVVSPVIKSCDF